MKDMPPGTDPGPGPGTEDAAPRSRARVSLVSASLAIVFATVFLLLHRSGVFFLSPQASASALPPSRSPSPASASSVLLYAASYDGTITSLSLGLDAAGSSPTTGGDNADSDAAAVRSQSSSPSRGYYSLVVLSTSDGCGPNPSWLTLDASKSVLYCSDEGLTSAKGSVSSLSVTGDGSLDLLDRIELVKGPVSAVVYGRDGNGLAVAQYSGSCFTSLNVTDPSSLSELSAETFKLSKPGTVPDRQEAPHPHEAVLDPTGRFVLVPDLGADLVRVFAVDPDTLALKPLDDSSLKVEPGSGPRHLAFLRAGEGAGGENQNDEGHLMYLVSELANTVTGYRVSYRGGDGIEFNEVYQSSAYGEGEAAPQGASVSEIVVSPDDRFVIVSSRSDRSFTIPDPDTEANSESETHGDGKEAGKDKDKKNKKAADEVPSDSLIVFGVDADKGGLTLLQKAPAGGLGPRHFSINEAGDTLAVGLQEDERVAVLARDVETGKIGDVVASKIVGGQVTNVIFA